ncbi:MAG: REDY-like protein HapK [Pseudomonadota bacterium]
MKRIVVLFNLKPGVDVDAYESWARSTDLPTVNALQSVDRFTVHKAVGLLGKDDKPPYEYIEIIDVNDMQTFGENVSTETMRKVAGEFQGFADAPVFILTDAVT